MSALEQTLAAEGALLGSLLLDPNMLPLVMAEVGAADFSQPSYRAIFDAIRAVDSGEGWVDVVSVGDELARRDLLDAVGGQEALLGLLGAVPSAVHAERYAREVKAAALRRTLAEVGAQIGGLADADRDVLDLVADAQTLLGKLTERATAQEGRTLAEALADYRLGLDTLTEQRDGLRGVQTGLMDINQITGGWMKSDLIILAARPGVGKSSLALLWALNAALAGVPAAYFSIEMPEKQLVERAVAMESGVDAQRLRLGTVNSEDLEAVDAAVGRLAPLPLTIYDTPALTVPELRAHCLRQQAADGLGFVVVDYLQLMRGHVGRGDNRQAEVAAISKGLKGLARELDVPVMALAQVNRAVEGRASHLPQLSDLRESGSIEADADLVIFIHREEIYEPETERRGVADIIFAKHRNGPLGTVQLRFFAHTTRFADFEPLDNDVF